MTPDEAGIGTHVLIGADAVAGRVVERGSPADQ
jgi:hypothetical protein